MVIPHSGHSDQFETVENEQFGVPTRSNTSHSLQSQKQVRSVKFRVHVEEELYCPCSEHKGADQLCSYCTADLRLCFRICRLLVSDATAHLIVVTFMFVEKLLYFPNICNVFHLSFYFCHLSCFIRSDHVQHKLGSNPQIGKECFVEY